MLPPPARRRFSKQGGRDAFRGFCLQILRERQGGGYITAETSRLLREAVRKAMQKLPPRQRDLKSLTRKVLARVEFHRITATRLAPFLLDRRRMDANQDQVSCEADADFNEGDEGQDEVQQVSNGEVQQVSNGAIEREGQTYKDHVSGYEYGYKQLS
ncbi:hypothetical protein P43SY_007214 [Pythium insidiosum]|uniref:Uncharacterized protein n=1 Tax=Pythium insidiosum TaxID=114742 RepID=A0AAD5Q706_PYTIN|nr:hypothetical protein P43SY_007214 [Pythium insidiosum]